MRFCFLLRILVKNIAKNVSKNLTSKYSQKLLDHDKGSATDTLKTTSKRVIQKTAEVPSYLTGHKIANKIRKVSKIHNKIFQRQLKTSFMKKYLMKYIYLRKKDR